MNNQFNHPWTEAERDQVKHLAGLGMSSGEISEQFEGRTRSSVCGLALRMGVKLLGQNGGNTNRKGTRKAVAGIKSVSIASQRTKNVRGGKPKKIISAPRSGNVIPMKPRPPKPGPKPVRPEYVAPTVAKSAYDAATPRVALADLTQSSCKFPLGDPRDEDFAFCGHQRLEGYPYCRHHAARSFLNFVCREEAAA